MRDYGSNRRGERERGGREMREVLPIFCPSWLVVNIFSLTNLIFTCLLLLLAVIDHEWAHLSSTAFILFFFSVCPLFSINRHYTCLTCLAAGFHFSFFLPSFFLLSTFLQVIAFRQAFFFLSFLSSFQSLLHHIINHHHAFSSHAIFFSSFCLFLFHHIFIIDRWSFLFEYVIFQDDDRCHTSGCRFRHVAAFSLEFTCHGLLLSFFLITIIFPPSASIFTLSFRVILDRWFYFHRMPKVVNSHAFPSSPRMVEPGERYIVLWSPLLLFHFCRRCQSIEENIGDWRHVAVTARHCHAVKPLQERVGME